MEERYHIVWNPWLIAQVAIERWIHKWRRTHLCLRWCDGVVWIRRHICWLTRADCINQRGVRNRHGTRWACEARDLLIGGDCCQRRLDVVGRPYLRDRYFRGSWKPGLLTLGMIWDMPEEFRHYRLTRSSSLFNACHWIGCRFHHRVLLFSGTSGSFRHCPIGFIAAKALRISNNRSDVRERNSIWTGNEIYVIESTNLFFAAIGVRLGKYLSTISVHLLP